MTKHILFFAVLFFPIWAFAQSKIEVGITAEGSWCRKSESAILNIDYGKKTNWGTGMGAYLSVPVWWRFSISSGLGYRYSEYQKGIPIVTSEILSTGIRYYTSCNWIKSSRNYIVIPLKVNLLLSQRFYITGGVEACRLMGYNYIKHNPEYNRIIGFGSRIKQMNWELRYVSGFKEQLGEHHNAQGKGINDKWVWYRTSMVQFSLSYPLWQK